MSAADEFYKREEDKKWRERTDERLVALTTDATVSNDRLDQIDDALDKLDKLIRGDPDEDREGIAEAIHMLQVEVRKFNRIFEKDSLGNGGLLADISFLMDKRKRHERREDNAWKYVTAISVQFLILIGLIVVNWANIQAYIMERQHIHDPKPISRDAKRLKAERAKKRHVKPPEVHLEQPGEEVSE